MTVAEAAATPSFSTVTVTTAFEIWTDPMEMPTAGSGISRQTSTAPTVRKSTSFMESYSAFAQSADGVASSKRHSSTLPTRGARLLAPG